MDITPIIVTLNPAQREAVTSAQAAQLVLAGAGSGKTRVLVHRIAWLMKVEGVSPHGILAVTFTNKAANEMRTRIEDLLNIPARALWVGTFHGLAHRFLRLHAHEAGLPEAFQVLDSDDQLRLIRRIMKNMELDEARWPPRQVQWFINGLKEEGRRARHLSESHDSFQQQMQQIYRTYEAHCDRSGLVDFAELLLRTHEFMRDTPAVLEHYQARFHHVLVDEFQDTNRIQYAWLRLLTRERQNLFAVGDDDQSIYSWRGAQVENLQRFQKDYPQHQLVRLEQNYRSTGNILNAANALIARNEGRLGKNLWTDGHTGELISVYAAFNEQEEAHFVVERIRQWCQEGGHCRDAAILYRSNAQSRQFEEKLQAMRVAYKVYGGLRFFERAEIKDALAYLRLATHPHDDPSFERIINTPTRGIGLKTLDMIRDEARNGNCSLWEAATRLCQNRLLSGRAELCLGDFLRMIGQMMNDDLTGRPLWEQVQHIIQHSGLRAHFAKEKTEQAEARLENLDELIGAARQFELLPTDEPGMSRLQQFLSHTVLESGDSSGDVADDHVQLMTLHAAKGLEFDLVFIVGLEEGLFPSQASLEETGRLEEERRLCYVGITRARKKLYLSHAESRRLYGRDMLPRPSRFLREIPVDYLHDVRSRTASHAPVASKPGSSTPVSHGRQPPGFKLGQRVRHARFGEGVILHYEGEGNQARVQVSFSQEGVKWLMLAYAQLEICS